MQALYRPRVPLWVSKKKKNAVKERDRDKWYGRQKSLLAQTFAETLKTRNETSFFLNTQEKIFPETLEIPSMVANSVVSGKSPYRLEFRFILCIQI